MTIENLTPVHIRCTFGAACQSIHRIGNKLVIVGKYASHMDGEIGDLREKLSNANKIGADETAIVIDEALLSDLIAEKVKDLVHAETESDGSRSGQPYPELEKSQDRFPRRHAIRRSQS